MAQYAWQSGNLYHSFLPLLLFLTQSRTVLGGRKCSFLGQGSSSVFSYYNKQNLWGKIHHKFCHSGEETLQKLQDQLCSCSLRSSPAQSDAAAGASCSQVPRWLKCQIPIYCFWRRNSISFSQISSSQHPARSVENRINASLSDMTQSPCRMRSQEHWTQKPTTLTKPEKHIPWAFNWLLNVWMMRRLCVFYLKTTEKEGKRKKITPKLYTIREVNIPRILTLMRKITIFTSSSSISICNI